MEVLYVLLLLLLPLVALWIIKRRKKMSILKDYGIPGPKPNLISGNIKEINKKGIHICLKDWEKQYGKIFGYYLGALPTIVVCDAELCKQIQIKDFNNFVNRPHLVPGREKSKFGQHIIGVENDKWKEQRALMTPTFTTGKMKQMLTLVSQSIDVLMAKIDSAAESGIEFNIHEYFKALTLDVIAKTAFGVQTNVQNNPNDVFYRGAQDVLREDTFSGLTLLSSKILIVQSQIIIIIILLMVWNSEKETIRNLCALVTLKSFFSLSVCFPEISGFLHKLIVLKSYVNLYFETNMARGFFDTCEKVVLGRRANPENRREDLLQLLVDAEMSQLDIKNVSGEHLTAGYESETIGQPSLLDHTKGKTSKKVVRLTDEEVMSNTSIMLFAGYETTSTALAYMSHILVNNPEIQDKIRDEIKKVIDEDGEITYNSIPKLKYLDQVWSETLRYYPPVPSFVNRVAINEMKYEQLTVPKGVTVQIPVSRLHKSPEYWKDPEKFDPERFSSERRAEIKQLAYQPFGAGPRNCIGLRFAQMEAKMALARLLNDYRLVPSEKTEIGEITVTMKFVIMAPKYGVALKAERIA